MSESRLWQPQPLVRTDGNTTDTFSCFSHFYSNRVLQKSLNFSKNSKNHEGQISSVYKSSLVKVSLKSKITS